LDGSGGGEGGGSLFLAPLPLFIVEIFFFPVLFFFKEPHVLTDRFMEVEKGIKIYPTPPETPERGESALNTFRAAIYMAG
jgi:hypothetical protein